MIHSDGKAKKEGKENKILLY